MHTRTGLSWRCRRGMRELDLLLLPFVNDACRAFTSGELQAFQRLLDYPDDVLLPLLMGRLPPPDDGLADVIDKIRSATARKA